MTRALSVQGAELPTGQGWSGPPGKARYRIDGAPKVLGQKIFARDFHSRDMAGWPATESCALVLRTPSAGAMLEAIDLSVLPAAIRPYLMITAAELARDHVVFPSADESAGAKSGSLFVALGTAPEFLGQPVAILLFKDFNTFRQARRLLQFNPSTLRFGASAPPPSTALRTASVVQRIAYKAAAGQAHLLRPSTIRAANRPATPFYTPPTYLTRYANSDGEQFSQVIAGVSDPYTPSASPADSAAAEWRARIQQDLQSSGWRVFQQVYETQQLDPMFMEPETGIGWLDRTASALHLVLGTQCPDECLSDGISMFQNSGTAFPVKTVVLNSCYPGGGFGGRDVSTFPSLLSIAAAYAQGPVRLAYDRFEQFQSGLKQLGANMSQSLAVDSQGKFQAVTGNYRLQAGGRNNYSQWIAQLTGYCGGGGYSIPRVSIDAEADASIGVIAGSMRGFGGPQAAFAMESLVDEIALELKIDPILLREKNALAKGGYTVTGFQISQSLRIAEICRLARAHPLWVGRAVRKQQAAARGRLYGAGFALANQAFGTGRDGVMAAVEIAADGAISVTSNAVDVGNGSATSLAISTAALGANASQVNLGDASVFSALQLTSTTEDWSNPQYTPSISMSSSACITAFHQVHAVEQACRVLLETALWPAARQEWGLAANAGYDPVRVRWQNGALAMSGHPPLPLARLAQLLHAGKQTTGAMVHAAFVGNWIPARFPVSGSVYEAPIDALALKQGSGAGWTLISRANVFPPPAPASNYGRSLYAPSGTLACVDVNPKTGEVTVSAVHTFLEAGRVVQPDLLAGQYQGGVAMGVGYALYEYLPPTVGGAGEGAWNLNRYRVAKWGDLPLGAITLKALDPVTPDEPARGIAEAVLCPVAPAIANAIAAATGRRFRSLPITPQKVREALGN